MLFTRTLTLLLSLLLIGCVSHPVTERSQLMLMPGDEALKEAAGAYANLLDEAAYRRVLNVDVHMVERVRGITARLIQQAVSYRPVATAWQWEVNVFFSDMPSAFCLAGGKIGVNSGLLEKLETTDDELAQVIGHEIAHALSEHNREIHSTSLASGMAVRAIVFSRGLNNVVSQLFKEAAQVGVNLPNSRETEHEADRVGTLIAAQAGYDPRAAVSFWQKVRKRRGEEASGLMSTHPAPAERIVMLEREAVRLTPVYLEARAR